MSQSFAARSGRSRTRSALRLGAASLAGLAVLAMPSLAAAEDAADAAAESEKEVVVTGSRLAAGSFQAPTPVSALGLEDFDAAANVNIADTLRALPGLLGSSNPTTNIVPWNAGPGSSYLNLRGVGPQRTLVLIDGRRHVPTTATGQVDISVVPTSLVGRIETVTGGASAAYGSDAVSGVVNVITRHLDGFEVGAQYGISEHGDSKEHRITGAFGRSLLNDRLRISVAGELTKNSGVADHRSRKWASVQSYLIPNVSGSGPAELIATDVHSAITSENGLINAGPLRGIEFLPGGGYRNFTYGTNVGPQYMIGGDGRSLQLDASLQVPLKRENAYGIVEFDITPDITAFGEFSYAHARSVQDLYYKSDTGLTIAADNAYLPADIRSQLNAAGAANFRFGRMHTDIDPYVTDIETRTKRAVLGLRGKFGDWSWDAYYQVGRTDYDSYLQNNRIQARFLQAIDAVLDPGTGRVVCRSTLTNPGNGCLPINLFGSGSVDPAAVAWTEAEQSQLNRIDQNVLAASLRGDLFQLPAGPVKIAFGGEYREEKIDSVADAISVAGGFTQGNPKPFSGKYTAKEGYLEVGVPLLRDTAFARALDLNLAYRITDYSTSGRVDSWKIGASWEPIPSLRFRATRSRDVRAPNLNELFAASLLQRWPLKDPFSADPLSSPTTSVYVFGNRNLKPERADTLTFGAVFTPEFVPGLRASVDYYDIRIDKAITTIVPQEIIDRCFAGAAEFCDYIVRNGSGAITHVNNLPVNVNEIQASGIDAEIAYRPPLAIPDGHLTLRLLLNYRDKQVTTDSKGSVDRAGDAATPRWSWTANATLKTGRLITNLEGRYVGGGDFDSTKAVGSINKYTVPSYFSANASIQYSLVQRTGLDVKLVGAIKNLFDAKPPLVPTATDSRPITNGALYDLVGRRFTAGFKANF